MALAFPFYGVDYAVFAVDKSRFLSFGYAVAPLLPDLLAAPVVVPEEPWFVVCVALVPPCES